MLFRSGYWTANVNYRFAPDKSLDTAIQQVTSLLELYGEVTITSSVPAGTLIQTPLFESITLGLNRPRHAKQAWTDVAQLTAAGVPAFNFGPGSTDQAHKKDEYIRCDFLASYCQALWSQLGG